MNYGYIGYSAGKGFISRGILFFRRIAKGKNTWPSHAFAIVKLNDIYWSIDAESNGVFLNPLNEYNKKDKKLQIYRFEVNESYNDNLKWFLQNVVGQEYGYLQFIGMIPVSLLEKLKIKVKNIFKWNWICSEVAFVWLFKNTSSVEIKEALKKCDQNSFAPDDLLALQNKFLCNCVIDKDFNKELSVNLNEIIDI